MHTNHSLRSSSVAARPSQSPTHWFASTAGTTLLVGAIVACIGSNADAQTSATPVGQNKYAPQEVDHAFSLIDTDSNGRLSRSEAVAFRKVANYFDLADSNRDGTLSPQEFATALNGGKPLR